MEIFVNGLIILTTRLEKHIHFTYFIIPLLLFQSFAVKCGAKIRVYCKQWNLIHILYSLNQSGFLFLSLFWRGTKQFLASFSSLFQDTLINIKAYLWYHTLIIKQHSYIFWSYSDIVPLSLTLHIRTLGFSTTTDWIQISLGYTVKSLPH